MLSLDTTTKSLEIKLAGAVGTTELPFVASYVDINQSSFAMSSWSETDGVTNGATAVVISGAAVPATTTRKLIYLSIVNVDTAAATVTVQVNNSGTKRISFKVTLQVGDQLAFTDAGGWVVYDTNGNEKTTMQIGAGSITNTMLAGSIAASKLVGSDITTVGTITAGVWNAGAVTSSGMVTATEANFSLPSGSFQLRLERTSTSAGAGRIGADINNAFHVATDAFGMLLTLSQAGALTVSGMLIGSAGLFVAGNPVGRFENTGGSAPGAAGAGIEVYANGIQSFNRTAGAYATFALDASAFTITSSGASGTSIYSSHASGATRFYSGGTTLRGTLLSGGEWLFGVRTTVLHSNKFVFDYAGNTFQAAVWNDSDSASGSVFHYFDIAGATIGSITRVGATSAVVFNTTSDQRLKVDQGIATDLSSLRALLVHDFSWLDGSSDRGIFAQESQSLYPRAITPGTDERTAEGILVKPWATDYSKFVPDLIVGWQQHDATIRSLEARIVQLEER